MESMSSIHAKNYFEHIGSIGVVNFWHSEDAKEYLHLLVLGCLAADWEGDANAVPKERYADEVGRWKVYKNKEMNALLEEFNQQSSINLQVYYLCPSQIEADIEDQIEPLTKHLVLIADPFSLFLEGNKKIAQLFNTKDKNKIRGCLIPVCAELEAAQQEFARAQRQAVLPRLFKGWSDEFYKSYTHVELDIPNKLHFFRRLSNIAYLREISEKETMARIELNSATLEQPPRP